MYEYGRSGFSRKKFNSSNSHPLFCLCCNGSWNGKYCVYAKGQETSMQKYLKDNSKSKMITFEINMPEMLFKVFYPDEETLYSSCDLSPTNYKDNMVLIFYSESSIDHSHEIIPI